MLVNRFQEKELKLERNKAIPQEGVEWARLQLLWGTTLITFTALTTITLVSFVSFFW